MQLYRNNLRNPGEDPWGYQMLDATSKIPSGVLYSYNFGEMGHFKQCLETESKDKRITGKYCLGTVALPTNSINSSNIQRQLFMTKVYFQNVAPLLTNKDLLESRLTVSPTWALCLPSNCTQEDVFEIMRNVSSSIGFQFTSFTCQTMKDVNVPLSNPAIITICIICLLIGLIFLSTVYDLYYTDYTKKSSRAIYTAFSVYSNGKKLFTANKISSEIECLNGIRFLSMVWVVSGHTFSVYTQGAVSNLKDVLEWANSLESMIMVSGGFSVDSFLVIGGALVVYVFTKAKVQGIKFNIFQYYLHRYLRLTPALAAVVLISATLLEYMGSGPKWNYIKSDFVDNCQRYWWTTLLYVQNYVNVNKMCVGQTWYLNIDMQLYLISPIILFLLWKYPRAGAGFLVLCIIIFIAVPFYIAYKEEMSGITTNFYPKTPSIDFMNHYYLKTHTRAAPWFIGALLGHILSGIRFRNFKTPRLNKVMNIFLWTVCLCVITTCILGGHSTLRSPEYDRLGNSFYIALVRPVWSLCLAWIIWSCAMGYAGYINAFLSLQLFQILNRFTYSIYLIHVTLIYMIVFSEKSSIYFTPINMAYLFWGLYMFSFGLSILWVLAFESPIIILERAIFTKTR